MILCWLSLSLWVFLCLLDVPWFSLGLSVPLWEVGRVLRTPTLTVVREPQGLIIFAFWVILNCFSLIFRKMTPKWPQMLLRANICGPPMKKNEKSSFSWSHELMKGMSQALSHGLNINNTLGLSHYRESGVRSTLFLPIAVNGSTQEDTETLQNKKMYWKPLK